MLQHEAPVETEILHGQMAIVGQLVTNVNAEGMPRTPGILVVTMQGPAWRIKVFDPDNLRSLTVLHQTLDEALNLVDALLLSANPPWSPVRRSELPL